MGLALCSTFVLALTPALLGMETPAQPTTSQTKTPHAAPCYGAVPSARIAWIEPTEAVDRHHLEERCRTIGPPVIVEAPASDGGVAMDSIIVVSWNIRVGGGDVPEFVSRLRSGRWTGRQPVEHFVLLLQEAHRAGDAVPPWSEGFETPAHIDAAPADHRGIVETGRRLGLHTFYAPSMRNGGEDDPREDRGNAILSTLPLSEHTVIVLPFEGQRRAAVAATIHGTSLQGHAWTLRVCSAHLDAQSKGLRTFASLGSGRARQARFLVDQLREGSTVLAGDLNTWTSGFREPAVEIIREQFPLPLVLSSGSTLTRRLLYDPRVDYMFFRLAPGDDAIYDRIEELFESDHHPLIATVPVLNLVR